jgi:hypothetical protein
MANGRWTNHGQPQTLVMAGFILYMEAVFSALNMMLAHLHLVSFVGIIFAIRICGGVLAGRGIADERRWAYGLALAVAACPFVLTMALRIPISANFLDLLFAGVLAALLLHTQSREYQRIWFK